MTAHPIPLRLPATPRDLLDYDPIAARCTHPDCQPGTIAATNAVVLTPTGSVLVDRPLCAEHVPAQAATLVGAPAGTSLHLTAIGLL